MTEKRAAAETSSLYDGMDIALDDIFEGLLE
jgi:hypothetical protein